MARKKKAGPRKLSRATRKQRTHNHEAFKGNCIAKWREYRGIESQSELAKLSGITRATVCRLENGTLPWRQWLLERLAAVLQCEPAQLITTNPKINPPARMSLCITICPHR